MQNPTILDKIIGEEAQSWFLWLALFFVVGVVYYVSFEGSFEYYFSYFLVFFIVVSGIYLWNRSWVLLFMLVFLCGVFYAKYYHKFALNFTKIDGKVFLDGTGRILEIKKSSLVLADLELYRSNFSTKKKESKRKKILTSTITNHYLNLSDHQEINREFLDRDESYMNIVWVHKNNLDYLPNVPHKIILAIRKPNQFLAVNDIVKFRVLLQPKEEGDFANYNKYHKISAFGFAIGGVEIVKKGSVNGIEEFFLSISEKINEKLNHVQDLKSRALVKAILIGKRDEIPEDLQDKIRRSGLAHLLAISGLHLSIIAGLCFMLSRFILVRFEYVALHYNIKKISVCVAIMASLFYLKISGEAVSVQRAFLMSLFAMIAMLIDEKADMRRMVVLALLFLVLMNPYILFMVAFQLSFIAVMSVILVGQFWQEKFRENLTSKFTSYFILIISSSFLIQILTSPILIKYFDFVSIIAIAANLVAIPLLSFVIMPFVFLLLVMMLVGIDIYLFGVLEGLMSLFIHIINYFGAIKYSAISLPFIFNEYLIFLLLLSAFGFFVSKNYLRYVFSTLILLVFLFGLGNKIFEKKDDIIWDKKHKFFALYDEDVGLIFSKKIKNQRVQEKLMKQYRQDSYKILGVDEFESKKFTKIDCDKVICVVEVKNGDNIKKIAFLLKRNKYDICDYDYDKIINLNSKYLLDKCL